jgi:hypothetical protein
MKEEAIRTHWSTDPVHAPTCHTYYKLASNLMDYHKNFKAGKPEEASGPKRARSSSSTVEGEEWSTSSYNPPGGRRKTTRAGRVEATKTYATGRRPARPSIKTGGYNRGRGRGRSGNRQFY